MKRVHEAENSGEDRSTKRKSEKMESEKRRDRIEEETTQSSKYEEMWKEEAARNKHGNVYIH